jgi:hypothetical protein
MTTDILYWLSIILLFIGQIFNTIASFISVPYKKITFWDSYKMSLPYIIIQRIFTNISIYYIDKFLFFTNNQLIIIILLMQFILTLIINQIYLHNTNTFSDYIGVIIIILAYYISTFNIITKILSKYIKS